MLISQRVAVAGLVLFGLGCAPAENYMDPDGPRYSGEYAPVPAAGSVWSAGIEGAASAEGAAVRGTPRISVVTFNIKFAEKCESAAAELASNPDLANADILLLQEMDAPGTERIARELGLNYVYYPGSVHENGRDFGNAVLSRSPIVDDAKLILPHRNPTDGRIRIAVQATLAMPFGEVSAYSVHTETPWLGPRARLDQARAVRDHASSSGALAIVGGDFNTSDPGSTGDTVELFRRAGFVWASEGIGDTAGSFGLDHIFGTRLTRLAAGTADTDASDHKPAWVRVELTARAP